MFKTYIKYYLSVFGLLMIVNGNAQNKGDAIPTSSDANKRVDATFKTSSVREVKNAFVVNRNTKEKRLKVTPVSEVNREQNESLSEDNDLLQMDSSSLSGNRFGKTQNANAYFNYLNSNVANRNYAELKKAYQLNKTSQELQFEMVKYYEIEGEKQNKKNLLKDLKGGLDAGIKEYAKNTLLSVEQNGILITYGKNDTYPLWILQELENVRTDVKVLNYDMLMDNNYRSSVSKNMNLKFSKSYSKQIDILTDVATKNKGKAVYYSLTVSHLALANLSSNLYATGLVLKYSKSKINNTSTLVNNWENSFTTTELKKKSKVGEAKRIEKNYLLPLVQLARHYKQNNNNTKLKETKELAIAIAERNGIKTVVEAMLKDL